MLGDEPSHICINLLLFQIGQLTRMNLFSQIIWPIKLVFHQIYSVYLLSEKNVLWLREVKCPDVLCALGLIAENILHDFSDAGPLNGFDLRIRHKLDRWSRLAFKLKGVKETSLLIYTRLNPLVYVDALVKIIEAFRTEDERTKLMKGFPLLIIKLLSIEASFP